MQANTTVIAIQTVSNNGSIDGLCQQIGGPPDYTYTSTCPVGTLPIGQLPEVSVSSFASLTLLKTSPGP